LVKHPLKLLSGNNAMFKLLKLNFVIIQHPTKKDIL